MESETTRKSEAEHVREHEVRSFLGGAKPVSRPTLYRLMKQHNFPKPMYFTGSLRVWKMAEVRAWCEQRRQHSMSEAA